MSDDDTYEIPLQDQRVFGAGIKRQRVKFVPSSSSLTVPPASTNPARSISDAYLSLVLPKESSSAENDASANMGASSFGRNPDPEICEVCKLPMSTSAPFAPPSDQETQDQPILPKPRPHETSLAHQICLTHSHPPSHLDRNRKGLAYLSAYGWDPDARLGLGAEGQGIHFPIKTKPKDDKLGIGVVLPKNGEIRKKEKPTKLDAGKIRKMYEQDKKKGEKLRDMFYRNDDVERYIGGS